MNTPKTLSDLKYQEYTAEISGTYEDVYNYASKWFSDAGITGYGLRVNYLFWENNTLVYECYVDSGSVDYLYIQLSSPRKID